MKKLWFLMCILLTACSVGKKFPDKMPDDFTIEYHFDGGMMNTSETITLKKDSCFDQGTNEGVKYNYRWKNNNIPGLESLYADLKKLNAFTLRSRNGGEVYDRGGESVTYIINGKKYEVSDAQSNFILKEDAENFNKSIQLIFGYALLGKQGQSNFSIIEPPEQMPDDFIVEYYLDGGMADEYKRITMNLGDCTYEGKEDGGEAYTRTWKQTDKDAFENLYAELRKLGIFTMTYTSGEAPSDRGGDEFRFSVNGVQYKISNSQGNFIDAKDAPNFNKAVELVVAFAETHFPKDENATDIPVEMPGDFKVEYTWEAGMTGDNRKLILQIGSCSDKGTKKIHGDQFDFSWTSKDNAGMQKLYNSLRSINAFTLKYTEKDKVYDRGGESLSFIINGKKYFVSNSGKCFIDAADSDAFKNAVSFVLNYADASH